MDEVKNRELPPAQAAALELLDFFVTICDKHNFEYVLGKETVMGIHLQKGFMPFSASINVILLYNQFQDFINVCKSELVGTPYYLITRNNTEQFDEFFIRIAKRSNVKLGEERKEDEKYYDFYINIIPAFYAGDTIKEYKEIENAFRKYYRLLTSRCLLPGMIKTGKKIFKQLRSSYYYSKKRPDDFDRTEATLSKYNRPSKFIYVPNRKKNRGSVRKAFQYTERHLYEFEGKKYYSVCDAEQYLKELYRKNYKKKYLELPVNQAVLEGPEILRRVQLVLLDMLIEFDKICKKHDIKYMLGAGTLLGAVRHKGFIPWDDDIDVFMIYEEYIKFSKIADKELNKEKYFLKTQETDLDNNLAYIQLKRNGTKYLKAGRENFITHPGVYIDIHPLFNGPQTKIAHGIQDKICKFFKTMTWAHMGAESEKNVLKRQYYRTLAKVSNKTAYSLFIKNATKVEKPSEKLSCFYIIRNFQANPVNHRRLYEELTEMEFEGHSFYVTTHWDEYLKYSYSKDYMKYPNMAGRRPKHMPAIVDVADLCRNLDSTKRFC